MTKAAARAREPVAQPPAARDPAAEALADAQAAYDRVADALAGSEANRDEALRRISEAEAAHEAAILSVRESSLALAADPVADRLLDDATGAMMRADTRLKALREQVLPAAERQLEQRRAELAEASNVLDQARFDEEVRRTIVPVWGRVTSAAHDMSAAFAEYQIARDKLLRFGQVYHRSRGGFSDRRVSHHLSPEIVRALQAIHHPNGQIEFPICAAGSFRPAAQGEQDGEI